MEYEISSNNTRLIGVFFAEQYFNVKGNNWSIDAGNSERKHFEN